MHVILHRPHLRFRHHDGNDAEHGYPEDDPEGLSGDLDHDVADDDADADADADPEADVDATQPDADAEDLDDDDDLPRRPRPRGPGFQSFPTFSTFPTIELQSTLSPPYKLRLSLWTRFKALIRPPKSGAGVKSEYIPNYRWLPIVSGIIVPFAILLEVPGLTERWYVRTEGNDIVDSQPNPPVLSTGVAISFICGVLANVGILARFFEYRVKTVTILAIIFLTIHDCINIATVTAFGVIHRVNDGFTYGQPFWITICSTIASSTANITLLVDLHRTPSFSSSGSGLTRKQRSLVIVIIILLVWIALGALVNSLLMDLSFINGLYFTVVSIETIGFGDITPKNTSARVFGVFYNTVGLLNVALAVGTMRETVIESFELSYRKRMSTLKKWRRAHRAHRANARAMKDGGGGGAGSMRQKGIGSGIGLTQHLSIGGLSGGGGSHMQLRGRKGSDAVHLISPPVAKQDSEKAITLPPEGLPLPGGGGGGGLASGLDDGNTEKGGATSQPQATQMTNAASTATGTTTATGAGGTSTTGTGRPNDLRGMSYEAIKKTVEDDERKDFIVHLTVAWGLFITFWIAGSLIFMASEGWSFGISVYFCFITFTTIGYGDYSPQSPAGRSIFVVWALMGVATMTILISVLSEAYSSRYKSVLHNSAFRSAVENYRRKQSTRPASPVELPTSPLSAGLSGVGRVLGGIAGAGKKARRRGRMRTEVADAGSKEPQDRADREEGRDGDDVSPEEQGQEEQEQDPDPSDPSTVISSRAQQHLEALPRQVLLSAKHFHQHVQYFASGGSSRLARAPMGLTRLLDEIVEAEGLDARLREEVVQDDDAMRTLLIMSCERSLRTMINHAQLTLSLLRERDTVKEQAIFEEVNDSNEDLNEEQEDRSIVEEEEEEEPSGRRPSRRQRRNRRLARGDSPDSSDSTNPPESSEAGVLQRSRSVPELHSSTFSGRGARGGKLREFGGGPRNDRHHPLGESETMTSMTMTTATETDTPPSRSRSASRSGATSGWASRARSNPNSKIASGVDLDVDNARVVLPGGEEEEEGIPGEAIIILPPAGTASSLGQ